MTDTYAVEHNVDLLDLLCEQGKITLERADHRLHTVRLERLRLGLLTDDGSDLERLRIGMVEQAVEDSASNVACVAD